MIVADVLVIGSGPAGMAAAHEASRNDAVTVMVEAGPVGGRATHKSMLAWRALEWAADGDDDDAWGRAQKELARMRSSWERRLTLRLEDAGVELVRGRGRFISEHEMTANGTGIRFDRAIIATGGHAVVPRGDPADGVRLLRPDDVLGLEEKPEELLVIGGGTTGAELVDALSRIGGVKLTWVMDEYGILPEFDRELADALGDVIMERGVRLLHQKAVYKLSVGDDVVSVELDGGHLEKAPRVVAAVGTRPALGGLAIGEVGLSAEKNGGLKTDDDGRTDVEHIFAIGDVTGRCASAAEAEAMGRRAGRVAALGTSEDAPPAIVPRIARTRPCVAQVGQTPEALAGSAVVFHTLGLEETIAGLLDRVGEADDKKGLVRIVSDSESGKILGATALGPGAEEVVSAVALALSLGATETDLQRVFAAVPGRLDAMVRAVR